MKTATIAAALMLAGCERVTEYKCSTEQIEEMKPQIELCVEMSDGTRFHRRHCFERAQSAHCEIVKEYHRTEIKAEE